MLLSNSFTLVQRTEVAFRNSEAVFQHHQHIASTVALAGDLAEVWVQLVAGNGSVDHADERGQIELYTVLSGCTSRCGIASNGAR